MKTMRKKVLFQNLYRNTKLGIYQARDTQSRSCSPYSRVTEIKTESNQY